ncbi:MAG: PspC domain-containing protein [Bacillota bacterium]
MGKRLYKTSQGAMLAGVCAGLAEYLAVDVTLVRLGFVFFSLVGGSGVLAYIVAAIIMPDQWQVADRQRPDHGFSQQTEWHSAEPDRPYRAEQGEQPSSQQSGSQYTGQDSGSGQRLLALILIGIGSYMLANRFFNLSYVFRHWIRVWWPLIPLLLGLVLLVSSFSRRKEM